MAHGLQVFDSTGNITLDSSDRITRLLATYTGIFYYNSGDNSLTISVPGFFKNNETYLLVTVGNFGVHITCLASESVTISYSSYTSGYFQYTIQHMGF